MEQKRVLITGITGMAGSHLAEYILSAHPQYQIFANKRWRSPVENIAHIQHKLHLIECDLTDPSGVQQLIRNVQPELIFHLAGQSHVPTSWINPLTTLTDNITMQLNIFESVRQLNLEPRIMLALSSEEYGLVHPHEIPINEKNSLRPLSPYAVSKVAQDMLGYQYSQSHGLKVIRLRAFNHEGPRRGEVFVSSGFAKQVAEAELGLRPPVIYHGNLAPKRDWTDVRDMVRAYWMGIHDCVPGEEYVICSGVARSVRSMLDHLLVLSKVKIDCRLDESRLRRCEVDTLVGDSSKFRKQTGWQTTISFEQTMEDLLNYWRQELKPRREQRIQSAPPA